MERGMVSCSNLVKWKETCKTTVKSLHYFIKNGTMKSFNSTKALMNLSNSITFVAV